MGLLGAIGSGLASAGGAIANIGMEQMRAAIEAERQERMIEMQGQMAQKTHAVNAQGDIDRSEALRKSQSTEAQTATQGLINARQTQSINKLYGDGGNLTDADISDEERAAMPVADKDRLKAAIQAKTERGMNAGNEIAELGRLNTEDRNASMDVRDQQRYETDQRRLDISQGQLDRQNRLAEATLSYQRLAAGKANDRAVAAEAANLRATYSTALKDIRSEMDKYEKENASMTIEPGAKAINDAKLTRLREEGEMYRKAMVGAIDGPSMPERPVDTGGAAVKYDASGKAWTRDASGKVVPYEPTAKENKPPLDASPKPKQDTPKPKGLINSVASDTGVEEIKVSGSDLTNRATQWSFGGKKYGSLREAEAARNAVIRQRKSRQGAISSTEQTDAAGGS